MAQTETTGDLVVPKTLLVGGHLGGKLALLDPGLGKA